MDKGPTELTHEEHKLQSKPTIKKVVSEQTLSNPTIVSNTDGHSDSNTSSNNKAAHITVQDRLLTKEVLQKIKSEQQATPITGNTLANYRNFKLKSQKEAE
jgi:L-asparaginase/Glu-tRNA(Gln) amidotransferase subunit D